MVSFLSAHVNNYFVCTAIVGRTIHVLTAQCFDSVWTKLCPTKSGSYKQSYILTQKMKLLAHYQMAVRIFTL